MGRREASFLLRGCGAHLLDYAVAVAQDLLRGQLLSRLDNGSALEDPPVRRELLSLRVHEDVGDADAVLVVVVAAVKGGDGAVGALCLHQLRLQHAVEEADDAWPAARDSELAVRGVDARGGRHGDAQVVAAGAVRVELRLHEAVGLDGGEVAL